MTNDLIAIERRGAVSAAALIREGRVIDLLLDAPSDRPAPEEIHLARIERVAPALGAVFARLEGGARVWLRGERGRPGEARLVQVSRWADPGKAAPVTDRITLKGRLVMLTPGAPGANLSRAIRRERDRLQALAGEAASGGEEGLVLRTAAQWAEEAEVLAETRRLRAEWLEIAARTGEPALLRPAPDAAAVAARDWDADPVDGSDQFERLGVWDAVSAALDPCVDLPGGGWMSVEATSAMIAVDVNTGDDFSKGASSRANLAACAELPRQLRLRGLGGVALIDLAPIKKGARQGVDRALKQAFAADPVETRVAGWTPLGNVELTRRRDRRPLVETSRFWEDSHG